MRSKKIKIFVISCIAFVSLCSETVFANNLQQSRNMVGTDISGSFDFQEIYSEKEPKISADISEEELKQGYEAFFKFVNDNNLSVTFDYEEFKQQYYALGYDGINDYLEALYGVFDFDSEEKDDESQTIQEPTFTNDPSNGTFYLDVASPSSGPHAKVKLWNTCINPEERWTILSNGDGTYRFINGYDGLCMDIANGSTQAGADVQVYPYEGTTDQKWKLQKTS